MVLIELGMIDYKILIPLMYPFLFEIRRIIHKKDEKFLFGFFIKFCGYSVSGIIYLIIKIRIKKRIRNLSIENIENLTSNFESVILEEDPKANSSFEMESIEQSIKKQDKNILEKKILNKKSIRNQYLFLLLLIIIGLIPMFLDSFAPYNDLKIGTSSSVSLFLYIFFYIFLSRLILGNKIYSHQILSSIIILISTIIIIILFFINNDLSNNIFINIIFIISITGLFSLFNILEKKYFNIYMDSPYRLMFIFGIFPLILILIYELFTDLIFGIDCTFNGLFYQLRKNIEYYGGIYILIFIGDILFNFILLAGIQLTIYFFTPCHFIISESISQIISTFVNDTIDDFPIHEKVIIYFLFVIIIFATFIYNEILVINICSLNKNTKKYIGLRQCKETKNIFLLKNINIYDEENNTDSESNPSFIY